MRLLPAGNFLVLCLLTFRLSFLNAEPVYEFPELFCELVLCFLTFLLSFLNAEPAWETSELFFELELFCEGLCASFGLDFLLSTLCLAFKFSLSSDGSLGLLL